MRERGGLCALALAAFALALPGSAAAAPNTTVQRTILDCDNDNLLEYAFGEPHEVFPGTAEQNGQNPCTQKLTGESPKAQKADSIVNFLQLSDFQTMDEESPARVEFLDATQRSPFLQPFSAAYRPQDSVNTQITAEMVKQARNTNSPVTGQKLDLSIVTGDNADNQEYDETRWFIDILDGTTGNGNPDPEMENPPDGNHDRKVDPNSGIPTSTCEATPGTKYDGVRDTGQRGVTPDLGYYEPDRSAPNDPSDGDGYSPDRADNQAETQSPNGNVTVRDFPGLLENANDPYESVGLDLPWYSVFGNHDALVQGNSPDAFAGPLNGTGETFNPVFHAIATGCVKVLQPSAAVLAEINDLQQQIADLRQGGTTPGELSQIDQFTSDIQQKAFQTLEDACAPGIGAPDCTTKNPAFQGTVDIVPPDPRRCFLPKDEPAVEPPDSPCTTGSWIHQHFRTTGTPVGHGFAPSAASDCAKYGAQQQACEQARAEEVTSPGLGRPPQAVTDHDGYYSFVPKPGLRFVVLDTITDECGLEVCSEGSVDGPQFHWIREQIEAAKTAHQYVVLFSHHTLRTTRFPSTDLTEGTAAPTPSTAEQASIHFGERTDRRGGQPQNPGGGETLEELYCEYPNVLGHVSGHEHENYVEHHKCSGDSPSTPGPGDFWHISTAAHIDWPQQARMIELVNLGGQMSFVTTMIDHDGTAYPGQGQGSDSVQRLAAIGREIGYNDYQHDRGARGERQDRNVILPTNRPAPGPSTP